MNKELYVYLFTYNAFVALRRPVGCSQDFVVSPYHNNSNVRRKTLNCSVVAMIRESTHYLDHQIYISGARNLNRNVDFQ